MYSITDDLYTKKNPRYPSNRRLGGPRYLIWVLKKIENSFKMLPYCNKQTLSR